MASIIVILKEDFDQFKKELIDEIRHIIQPSINKKTKWLRSSDLREMLNISDSTLQTFRINGTIPAYKLDSIMKLLKPWKREEINKIYY